MKLHRILVLAVFGVPFFASAQANLSCTIWSDKETYAPGETALFQWLSVNARSASLDGVGPVALSGFRRMEVSQPGRMMLRVRGTSGSERVCSVSYQVRAQRPTCHISAIPLAVAQNSFVTLSWQTQYASGVSISGIGTVPASGSRIVRAERTNTYTLTAVGPGGSCTFPTTVSVQSPVSAYGYFPTVVNSIAAPLFGYSQPSSYDVYYFDTYYEPVYQSYWYEEYTYKPDVWYEEHYYSPSVWPMHDDEDDIEIIIDPGFEDRPLTPWEFERSWEEGGRDSDNDWRFPPEEDVDDSGVMPTWDGHI
jgi:hypothetical protein